MHYYHVLYHHATTIMPYYHVFPTIMHYYHAL
jgi:hypothetical protein